MGIPSYSTIPSPALHGDISIELYNGQYCCGGHPSTEGGVLGGGYPGTEWMGVRSGETVKQPNTTGQYCSHELNRPLCHYWSIDILHPRDCFYVIVVVEGIDFNFCGSVFNKATVGRSQCMSRSIQINSQT